MNAIVKRYIVLNAENDFMMVFKVIEKRVSGDCRGEMNRDVFIDKRVWCANGL